MLFGAVNVCRAADAATPAELLKEAKEHMAAKRFEEAATAMYMYLGEVEESELPRVIAIAQDIRFKLATILIQADRLDEAAAVLEEYVAQPAATHPRQARKMLSTCYFEIEDFEGCVTATTNAIEYNANPVVQARRTAQGGDEDDEDYSKYLDEEPEEEFTPEEVTTLHMTLGEAHYGLENWTDCIAPYEYVIANTPNEQRKGYAIMQIINALIEIPAFDRIMEWVPQLYRTPARYDIRVNLALMDAAAALYDAEEYDSALPLYRMILPRDELVAYQEQKLRDIRIAHGLPPEEGLEMTADEMMLFGVDDDPAAAEGEQVEEKPKEVVKQENWIARLKELPPYEVHNQYRMADLYKTVERHWESFKFFDMVYTADPENETGERSIYEMVDSLIEYLDEPAEAERRGFDHMSKYPKGVTSRQIAYMITGYHQKIPDWAAVKRVKPYLDELVRTNNTDIIRYDAELYFMQGVADLVLQNFEDAEAGFKFVLDEYPNSHQEANCRYWYAMSKLFLQKYADAFPDFEYYIKKFPTEDYVDECNFQAGICLFGQEQYTNALERFSLVIDTYPDSSVYPEACSMRGDIYGSWGGDWLDKAVLDYERACATASKPNQATYATFQMANIFEAEERYDEIIRAVEAYLDQWKGEADIAKALFWIGKTKIQQGLVDEAVETYLDAIVEYGGDLRQDGVDLMISELVKIGAIYLDTEQQTMLRGSLQSALDASENLTLQLRLRVLLAKLDKTENELGLQLIKELPNLDNASPPVLATICDASFEQKDYSRADEMLRIFLNKFEDSEFMRAAYKLRGYGQYAEGDYDGALATINDAQALYGTDYDVSWAQLMKAQILLDQGVVEGKEGAREANMSILSVPSWRGAPVAQATYQLGQLEEKIGRLAEAHAFYQRAYFQYKGHSGGHWAAEGYLAAARVLDKMGRTNDMRNTYRAMLFDRYINSLPQADVARKALGAAEAAEIETWLEGGGVTNITVSVESEMKTAEPAEQPAAAEESL